ncbi:hypothetical protein [Burkholderia territorii]|uniref:hypothetical protein n=1 Tax=Burkholderia territorii TaxID=1503055 RepID=UPI0022AB4A37|nr:hypothetical protein [Burkholderia territorii]
MLARIDRGAVRLITRNGHDWTTRMPHLRRVLDRLPVTRAWLDAEAVWVDGEGAQASVPSRTPSIADGQPASRWWYST